MVHQVLFVSVQNLLDLFHQVNDESERNSLALHDLLIVHQLDLLQLLEGLILALVETKVKVPLVVFLSLFDLDVGQLVVEHMVLSFFFPRQDHQHHLGYIKFRTFLLGKPFNINSISVKSEDIINLLSWLKFEEIFMIL